MASTKDIRRRIKSIKSTRQITRAMELVAAAKMRRAQSQALATRTYARLVWELTQDLASKTTSELHRLLRRPEEIKKIGVVLMTSNRGLIGGFNNNVINTALEYAARPPLNLPLSAAAAGGEKPRKFLPHAKGEIKEGVEFITVGKKGRDAVRKRGFTIAAEFEKKDTAASVLDIVGLSKLVVEDFVGGKYDRVVLVYMDFVSTLVQKPVVREALPLSHLPSRPLLERGGTKGGVDDPSAPAGHLPSTGEKNNVEYLFEPSPDQVLEVLLPRLIEMQIYQALLETNASEHSARMVAMKNASDAASDLVDELTLEFNQLRQASITKEISEIVAGRLALK